MKKAFALIAFFAAIAAQAETIFIEAESFEDYGGWVNDTQFMDQMGSPYLLAHGLGKPVADAKTTFSVEKGGRYKVWIRTKNWTSPWHPDIGAGTFNLVVNGEKLPNLLGCQGKGEWLWVKADDVTLKDGKNTLALHDLDGFDGRADAIVFTTDPNPQAVLDGPRHPSVVVKRTPSPKCDLCVVGGGIAGICTAVSAARLGRAGRAVPIVGWLIDGWSLATALESGDERIQADAETVEALRALAEVPEAPEKPAEAPETSADAERERIEREILDGVPERQIAARHGVTVESIRAAAAALNVTPSRSASELPPRLILAIESRRAELDSGRTYREIAAEVSSGERAVTPEEVAAILGPQRSNGGV